MVVDGIPGIENGRIEMFKTIYAIVVISTTVLVMLVAAFVCELFEAMINDR